MAVATARRTGQNVVVIPFFEQPRLSLGPITIHAFGVMVALAVIVGARLTRRRAEREGLDGVRADRLVTWILVGGFLGAHLVDRFVYFPGETLSDPWSILRVWDGLSSFGGFLGAVVGAVLFVRRGELRGTAWRYLDCVAYAFPFGWIFGRTGCFLAFDHPGAPTTFLLAQMDADGIRRHNLGLEEAIYTVALSAVIYLLGRRPRPAGFFVGALAVLYAPVRFIFDFLRVRDVRYFGLTPGQWGALALLLVGVAILTRAVKAATPAPTPAP